MRTDDFWYFSEADARGSMFFNTPKGYRPSDFRDGTAFDESVPEFVCESGSRVHDVMETTVGYFLVSAAFLNALRSVGATGWASRPALVFEKRHRREIHGFSVFFPEGRAGPPRWDLSRRELRPPIVPNVAPYTVAVGLMLDANQWDGSDVFWPQGTTFTCMTTKAARAIEQASVSNIRLVPADKFEIWEAAITTYDDAEP